MLTNKLTIIPCSKLTFSLDLCISFVDELSNSGTGLDLIIGAGEVDVDALIEDVVICVDDGSTNKEGDGVITKGDVISAEFKVEISAVDASISDVAANEVISLELDAWIKGVEDTFICDVVSAIDATANEEGWRLILTDDVTVFEVLAIGDDSKVNVSEVNKMNT